MYINNNQTVLEDFSVIGLSKTHATNSLVLTLQQAEPPWPAEKAYNGVLGINSKNKKLQSILEIENGYNVGLIANQVLFMQPQLLSMQILTPEVNMRKMLFS